MSTLVLDSIEVRYGAVRAVPGTSHFIRTDLSSTLFLTDPGDYDGGELVVDAHGPAGDPGPVDRRLHSLHQVLLRPAAVRVQRGFDFGEHLTPVNAGHVQVQQNNVWPRCVLMLTGLA